MSKFTNVLKAKEDLQKSPQQLEQERREVLKTRIIPLDLDGKSKTDLVQMAKKLHHALTNIHSQIYDLTERYERQKYDMVELTERARQIEKGKAKTRKSNVVHTGLGGSAFDWLADQYTSAPPKVSLFSRYERVTDRRSFQERRDAFLKMQKELTEPKDLAPIEKPKAKIRQVETHHESEPISRRSRGPSSVIEEERQEEVQPERKASFASVEEEQRRSDESEEEEESEEE
ncbi:hypothetical protein ACOME3_005194 [Neoechinorhynchus agilis]